MKIDGQLEQAGTRSRLRFTRSLAHPPEKVWRALTEPEQLAAWFPHAIVGAFVTGGTLSFESREGDDPAFEGRVVHADPPRLLEYTWGEDQLRFELEPDGGGTLLTFTDTFDEHGKAARDGAGWHACLDELGIALDGAPLPWDRVAHWREIYPGYIESFGPEASTIGPPAGHPVNDA
jgi:uncharacterized protein YndB with AHSA1/START domain